ncbi:uncharacterized protein [Littorina saxatilis]|uniref:uncharacterized protein n=1 Tax=Littorina saxatilis TaxID=31220 RepID=UPI0038B646BD
MGILSRLGQVVSALSPSFLTAKGSMARREEREIEMEDSYLRGGQTRWSETPRRYRYPSQYPENEQKGEMHMSFDSGYEVESERAENGHVKAYADWGQGSANHRVDEGTRRPGLFIEREKPYQHASRKSIQADKYDGTSIDLNDYLEHFDGVSTWNEWTEEEKGIQLSLSLRGAAQQVLGYLQQEEKRDFVALTSALAKRFSPKERVMSYRCEFRNRRRRKQETVEEYGFALCRLATRAYRDMETGARELILIEQFIGGLSEEALRERVQFGHPSTLDEAVSLAGEYVAFKNNGFPEKTLKKPEDAGSAIRYVGGGDGKKEENANEEDMSRKVDMLEKKIEELSRGRARKPETGSCFVCGDPQHFARQCPRKKERQGGWVQPRGNAQSAPLN